MARLIAGGELLEMATRTALLEVAFAIGSTHVNPADARQRVLRGVSVTARLSASPPLTRSDDVVV